MLNDFVGDEKCDDGEGDVGLVLVLIMISDFGHPFGITIPSYISSTVTFLEQTGRVEVTKSCTLVFRVLSVRWLGARVCAVD